MLDLAFVRSNFDQVAERLATRGGSLPLDHFRELDRNRRAAITEAEQLKARKNAESAKIGQLKRSGADTTELQAAANEIGGRIATLDQIVKDVDQEFQELMTGLPNVPHESVPVGKSEEDNVEVRRHGAPTQFDFEPKAHWDLGPELGILDFDRAVKITGARF